MKNREKFAEQIIDIALQRDKIAVNLTSGELCACAMISWEMAKLAEEVES